MSTSRPGYARDVGTGTLFFVGRYQKPSYQSTQTTKVTVPASSSQPAFYIIGGQIHTVTSTLTCNFAVSGVGGLAEGSFAANTPYYIYGVYSTNQVKLVADKRPPSAGPRGFGDYTYIGATATDSGSASITAFYSTNGFYLCDDEVEIESVAAGGSRTAKKFASMPSTAKKAYVQLQANAGAGAAIGEDVTASGKDATHDAITATALGAGQDGFEHGFVSVFTAQTLYLTPNTNVDCDCQLTGWVEDVSSWK